jgi:hypothetical protein
MDEDTKRKLETASKIVEASYEERRAWDRFMARAWPLAWAWACHGPAAAANNVEPTAALVAGRMADHMLAERRKRFSTK